jgi:MFS family permease
LVRPAWAHFAGTAAAGVSISGYDFYLYGSLAGIIAKQFFSGLDAGSAFIFALLAFAAGFIVRPFGAIFFGRLGDMIGRKHTFLVTILIMGLSTFIVGILPNCATIGVAAPVILIALRLLQGLALGGEYGGAATYVAEHAPMGKRGAYTSWIQTTATLGLMLSLMVILGTRTAIGEAAFSDWGWRVPFLVSILLAAASVCYENAAGAAGTPATIKIGETVIAGYSSKGLQADEAKKKDGEFKKAVADALKAAGYPTKADPARVNTVMVVLILSYLVLLVTMVYGPIAAMLVEMFPTRIRYTSMSLPYHIGNGWFGGLLPTTAFAIVAQTGNMYNGLWYPIIIAGMTFIIGTLFVKETKDVDIYAND